MRKALIYTWLFINYLFYKIEWVENEGINKWNEFGYTGYVLKKRIGSFLIITPIGLVVFFFLYGLKGFINWFQYITSYYARYITTKEKQLTFKKKLELIHNFIS